MKHKKEDEKTSAAPALKSILKKPRTIRAPISLEMRERDKEAHQKQIERHQQSLQEAKSKVKTNLVSCLNKDKTTINKFKPLTPQQLD